MRPRKDTDKNETPAALRLKCALDGAWFWFRAEGQDEDLLSATHRLRYHTIKARLDMLGIEPPTAKEMYAIAADKWPAHKLYEKGAAA